MKALTIWQPWASLIMIGAKPYEFRRWPAPRGVVGQRIVIHAGARRPKPAELADLVARLRHDEHATGLIPAIALPALQGTLSLSWMLAVGLGTAVLGKPRRCTDLFRGTVADSDRIDECMWAWPLTGIEPFDAPVPRRGAQGFWEW